MSFYNIIIFASQYLLAPIAVFIVCYIFYLSEIENVQRKLNRVRQSRDHFRDRVIELEEENRLKQALIADLDRENRNLYVHVHESQNQN